MRRPIVGLTCNELDKKNLPKQFINEAIPGKYIIKETKNIKIALMEDKNA